MPPNAATAREVRLFTTGRDVDKRRRFPRWKGYADAGDLGQKNSFNVQKVLWCCEELEVPYQRHDAGGRFGVTDQEEYLDRNPTGLVPTIVDGDLTLWESNSIVRYLAANYGAGSLWPENPAERALADKWMDYQLGTLFPTFKDALVGLVRTAPEIDI